MTRPRKPETAECCVCGGSWTGRRGRLPLYSLNKRAAAMTVFDRPTGRYRAWFLLMSIWDRLDEVRLAATFAWSVPASYMRAFYDLLLHAEGTRWGGRPFRTCMTEYTEANQVKHAHAGCLLGEARIEMWDALAKSQGR